MALLRCERCGHVNKIEDEDLGKTMACEACGTPCCKPKPIEEPKLANLTFWRKVVLLVIGGLIGVAVVAVGEVIKNARAEQNASVNFK